MTTSTRRATSRASIFVLALLLASLVTAALQAAPAAGGPDDPLAGLRFRSIGPYRGGRVTAVAGVRGQPNVYFFGATGGGVWKTTDAGTTWEPISDHDFHTGSIGAIAVAPSDPNVLYVGTGESPIRGNLSSGDGLYKSTDAGATWSHLGLAGSEQIARVAVDPRDPERVYVAAQGSPWGPSEERGVYRSRDGGRTWQRVLFVSQRAGACDLALDPTNPRVLYAAFWQVVRRPWTIDSGGPDSGLYESSDGGDSWKRLGGGLPEGVVGRIGVAVAPAQPQRVWAIVEAKDGGVYRSDDGGESFVLASSAHKLRERAWYYSWIYADPKNADTVWVPNVELHKSIDQGKTFTAVLLGDTHDLWIDPDNPQRMILGDDGGARVSVNGGQTWSSEMNQPTAQIYRVLVDRRSPYWIYGAQQDQGTIAIPSAVPGDGIGAGDWYDVGGGESAWIAPDPRDPDQVWAGSYGGSITRYDHRTRQAREVSAELQPIDGMATRDLRYRFNWNAPVLVSRHDPDVLYHAAQKLLRSRDRGETWEEASPDLTRNDPARQGYSGGPIGWEITGAEVYDTIFALAESPQEKGTLWAGTDDGLVWMTTDDGGHWTQVTPPGLPEWAQVNSIELSPLDSQAAYVVATRYKLGDRRPYIFRTRDRGRTWTAIVHGIPDTAFARAVREDPERRGLLYAGTEAGLYVSFDDGDSWRPWRSNLPPVPITDLAVAQGDLVVATQGRAFWVLDDLSPLHAWRPEIAAADAFLFPPRAALRRHTAGPTGDHALRQALGENAPQGVAATFWLKQKPPGDVTLEILDGGRVLRTYSSRPATTATAASAQDDDRDHVDKPLEVHAGINRVVWDLRESVPALLVPGYVYDDFPPQGVMVPPGRYTVRLRVGERTLEQTAEILPDPAVAVAAADLARQAELARQAQAGLASTHRLVRGLRDLDAQLATLARNAPELATPAQALQKKLDALSRELLNPDLQADEDSLVYTPALDFQFAALASYVTSADAAPRPAERQRLTELEARLQGLRQKLDTLLGEDLAALVAQARAKGYGAIVPPVELRAAGGGL
ncbi:MAG: VPS10 domain-containing protein [Acidobacteriota bacterium]